jgi:lycopene cyclase domain-containing protein
VSYTVLVGLALAGAVAIDLVLLSTRLLARRAFWVSYAILGGFQLLVNGILTGVPIVSYDRADILGPRLAYAPIEDLGFGFALILLTLSSWVALGRRPVGARGGPPDSPAARPAAGAFARRWRAGAGHRSRPARSGRGSRSTE